MRFRPPQPFEYDNVTWDVSKESYVKCPQPDLIAAISSGETIIQGQEDCLLLNIYVPEVAFQKDELLTVMVWIHGGALLYESNGFYTQGPEGFMDRNVIIVALNYRLGPLGFLSLGTNEVSGNAGFLDQNLALKWVQKNIEAFHGDPTTVTLFGESAGSVSVTAQFLSPMSQGLFKRIILQSNTPLSPAWGRFLNKTEGMNYGKTFAEKLDCNQATDVLECLQNKSLQDILALTNDINPEGGQAWMGVLDDKFMLKDTSTLLANGDFDKNVEVIVSTTKDEGMLFWLEELGDSSKWQEYQDNFETKAPKALFNIHFNDDITTKDKEKAYKVFEHYIGSIESTNEDNLQGLFDLMTDAGFLYGIHKTTNYLLKHQVKVYQAIFTYRGEHSYSQSFGLGKYGVCHGDDLLYLWRWGDFPLIMADDIQVRNVVTDAWVNFAKYGNPTPSGSELSWLPVDNPEKHNFWNISGPNPEMTTSKEIQDRMNFWNQLLEK